MHRLLAMASLVSTVAAAGLVTGCAARAFTPPTDPGVAFPTFADVYADVSRTCSNVRTFTAELGLSGHVGAERVRGRVLAGFRTPDAMRLEGVAPIGAPAFVLAAQGGMARLLLPRDNAAVTSAEPGALLDALTGVSLAPADLMAILTGCVVRGGRAREGALHGADRASIALDPDATLYLERSGGRWGVRGARRQGWLIEYPQVWQGAFPARVSLRATRGNVDVELSATIAQVEANVDLDDRAFVVEVPAGTRTLGVDDLRQAGPLRGQP